MGKKITDIKDFPKGLLEQKKLSLFKCFIIRNPDEKMDINQNIELMFTNFISAFCYYLDDYSLEELDEFQQKVESGDPVIVSGVRISLDMKDLKKKDIVDEGDPYYDPELGKIAITLSNKKFDITVSDYRVTSLSYTVDMATEKRGYETKLEPMNESS